MPTAPCTIDRRDASWLGRRHFLHGAGAAAASTSGRSVTPRSSPCCSAMRAATTNGHDGSPRGDWIGSDVFYQAPLYPYFLGVLYTVFGHDLLIVRIVQAVVGALSAALLGLAAWRLLSPRGGTRGGLRHGALRAGDLLRRSPAEDGARRLLHLPGAVDPERLHPLIVESSLACHDAAMDRARRDDGSAQPHPRECVGAGGRARAVGARRRSCTRRDAAACWRHQPAQNGTAPAPARSGSSAATSSWGVAAAAAFALGLALVLLPVAARNYAVGGGFYLTTSQFGPNFFIGNNPRADGTYAVAAARTRRAGVRATGRDRPRRAARRAARCRPPRSRATGPTARSTSSPPSPAHGCA